MTDRTATAMRYYRTTTSTSPSISTLPDLFTRIFLDEKVASSSFALDSSRGVVTSILGIIPAVAISVLHNATVWRRVSSYGSYTTKLAVKIPILSQPFTILRFESNYADYVLFLQLRYSMLPRSLILCRPRFVLARNSLLVPWHTGLGNQWLHMAFIVRR